MAPRGEVLLQITFGPSKSFVFPRAVTYASEHAKEVAEVHPGIWRASFSLLTEQRAYAHALQLLYMVHGWRASILAVNGDPEPPRIARQMLDCARRWLQTEQRCQAPLPPSGFAKCRICPLFDPEWAAESYVRPELMIGPQGPFWCDPDLGIPDYLPDEWEEPG